MVVLRRVELVSLDFGLVLHLFWALICLVVGLVSLGLMSGIYFAKFLVHFRLILCVIPTCPPGNGKSPKLVELISSKALCLGLVFILAVFI